MSSRGRDTPKPRRRFPWSDVVTTLAAFVLAFLVGALLMIFSDTEVRSKFSYFFARPSDALTASWEKVSTAYGALITGAIGGYGPITETTAQAAPLICAGLGVGLAFRAGPVQHRRPGPGHRRRDARRVHRLQLAPAAGHPPGGRRARRD